MDKWNNYDEWDLDEPMWKEAVDFANKYHSKLSSSIDFPITRRISPLLQ